MLLSVRLGQEVYNKVAYKLFEMAIPQQCLVKLQIGQFGWIILLIIFSYTMVK